MANDDGLPIADADAMTALGKRIAGLLAGSAACIALEGQLGAGKTTLARGMLRGLGYTGVVRSPTYTLMEEYPLARQRVVHLDLYRLADPGELEYLGLRDRLAEAPLILVEWGERARGELPPWDLILRLDYQGESRRLTPVPVSAIGWRVAEGLLEA